MEQVKDCTNSNNSSSTCCNTTIAERKRTTRPRVSHPPPASATTSSASSAEFSSGITEEDEDVANCLMLLSRGRRISPASPAQAYECKTCNKSFPSFQALGGHRASHKKPKTPFAAEDGGVQVSLSSCVVLAGDGSIKSRAHECSICGLEFSSGQALGGHMRRHRAITAAAVESPEIIKKQRSSPLLQDLNLPAPLTDAIDHSAVGFPFSSLVDCQY